MSRKLIEEHIEFRNAIDNIPSTTFGTFGLYRYPAKFIPQVIAYALSKYGGDKGSVFDPFAGYGTVGTVARLYGFDYELWDLNPLLSYLHEIVIMKPPRIEPRTLIEKMSKWKKKFDPDWQNIDYWFNSKLLPMISKSWGYYHSLEDEEEKLLLLIPLLKATRYFSYNDQQRQKLSRSPLSTERVNNILSRNWENTFFKKVLDGIVDVSRKLNEYQTLNPKKVKSTVFGNCDALSRNLKKSHDILITSPPYLQAQEYIRSSKMDLFWLGFSETEIQKLGKLEIPYRDVPEIEILSKTYNKHISIIEEEHIRKMFQRYFHGIVGILSKLQPNITKHILLFVGSANVRGNQVPLDHIFIEHFRELGWVHSVTLIDTIMSRQMFLYKTNPATGIKDNRMSKEHLVVLSRS